MKLISLNVEGNKHWHRIIPFLKEEKPDVFCVQEVLKCDMALIEKETGMQHSLFVPMALYPINESKTHTEQKGIALFTNNGTARFNHAYYKLPPNPLVLVDSTSYATKYETHGNALAWVSLEHEQQTYTIVTTHLVVTEKGIPNEFQTRQVEKLLEISKKLPPHVICGDFNMPRSINTLYKELTRFYADAIPSSVEGSLDPELHRANLDPIERERIKAFMVDYIFTTPEYSVKQVQLHSGVSDHCAVIANLEKTV